MTILIEREPAECAAWGGFEPCAVGGPSCRGLTAHWTALADRAPGAQVACCEACAEACEPSDVPSKDEWFDRVGA